MAPRIRSVHPDLCVSETMARVSAEAERTFVRLLTQCDDAGRAVDNPKLWKASLFPLHDEVTPADIAAHLDELETHGLIVRYSDDSRGYLAVRSWAEFQHPQKPKPSKLPDPSDTRTPRVAYSSATPPVPVAPGVEWSGVDVGEGEEGDVRDADTTPDASAELLPLQERLCVYFSATKGVTSDEVGHLFALPEHLVEQAFAEVVARGERYPSAVKNRVRELEREARCNPPGESRPHVEKYVQCPLHHGWAGHDCDCYDLLEATG